MDRGTIAIVDDTDEVREVLEMMLEQAGFKVYSFARTDDVQCLSENVRIDLFLIDIGLPGTDGIELFNKLNVNQRPYEAIMMTGSNDKETTAAAMKLGAFGFLRKPFSFKKLISTVDAALTAARLKRQQGSDIPEEQEMALRGLEHNGGSKPSRRRLEEQP